MYKTSKIMMKLLTLHLAQYLRCDIINVYPDLFFPSVLLAQFQQVKLASQIQEPLGTLRQAEAKPQLDTCHICFFILWVGTTNIND